MIKDVFNLKKNAWHMKLMHYMWGFHHYDFSHICPYFWLSVLNVVIFIPYMFFRGIIVAGTWVVNKVDDYMETSYQAWERDFVMKIQSSRFEFEAFAEKLEEGNLKGKLRRFWCNKGYLFRENKFFDKGQWYKRDAHFYEMPDSLEEIRERLRVMRAKRIDEEEKKKMEASIARKKRINRILKIVKPISIAILWIAAVITVIAVGWVLYKFYHYLISVTHKEWIHFFKVTVALATIVSLVVLVFIGGYILSNFSISPSAKKRWAKFGLILITPFIWIWKVIVFIGMMIKSNCPAVKWED